MEYELTYMLTALVTSLVGSLVRIFHDSEKEKIKAVRIGLIIFCSLVTGYICYELALYYQKSWIVGVPSIVLALAAVEITKFFRSIMDVIFNDIIKKIPRILDAFLKSFLTNYKKEDE